jgi:uncharacterized protein
MAPAPSPEGRTLERLPLSSLTKGPVTIREFHEIDLKSAMLIEAFPTIGLVSTIAASYLVSQLKLDLVGTVTGPFTPPVAVIYGGRALPPIRLYAGETVCGIDGTCDQVFLLMSEFPLPDQAVFPVADALLDWAQAHGCREVVSLEGLPREVGEGPDERAKALSAPPALWGVGATDRARAMLKRESIAEMQTGVITGISGVLMWLAEQRKVDALCLLAEALREFPDARAAAGLVRSIDVLLKRIDIKLEPLLKQAEELETEIKAAIDAAMHASGSRASPKGSAPSAGMYY